MLQYDRGLDVAHNAQGNMAHGRAMEHFSQHPQLNGNGRQRRKANMESEEMEGEGGLSGGSRPMSRLVGHGRKKSNSAQREHAREGQLLKETMEAHEAEGRLMGEGGYSGGNHPAYHQGKMLADFIRHKHGDGHAHHMLHGMLEGGAWWDFLDPNKNGVANAFDPNKNGVANVFDPNKNGVNDLGRKIKNEFVNNDSVLRQKVLNPAGREFSDPNSTLRGKVIPIAAKVGQFVAPALNMVVPGAGTAISTGLNIADKVNSGANALGYGRRKGGRNHAFKQRVAQVMERADMGNPHSKSAKRAMKSIRGMGQPNGVPESLGSPSNGGDPSGAVDVGRVANPANGFERNTVGMGRRRQRVGENPAGIYHGMGGNSGGYGGVNHQNQDGGLNFGTGGVSGGKKRRAKAGVSDARKKRGAEVSRLMREKGMSLGEASKYIKQHGY